VLTLQNSDDVRRDAALIPFVERLGRVLQPLSQEVEVFAVSQEVAPVTPWLVLTDERDRGLAVWGDDLEPAQTPIRRAIVETHRATRIGAVLNECGLSAIRMRAISSPPETWRQFEIRFRDERCLCALDPSIGEEISPLVLPTVGRRSIRLRIESFVEAVQEHGVEIESLPVWIPELQRSGTMCISEDGKMACEINHERYEESDRLLRVRVDLGEIELALEDLLSIRVGSRLDIGTAGPIECSLSIGAQALARGILEPIPTGFKLRITKTASADRFEQGTP
jgi:hypothetical protein